MKKTTILIVLATLCLNFWARGQTISGSLSALKVGEQVPDVLLKNVLNQASSSVKLSDFRGKVILLDFWATWCSACIGNFPKVDALAERFSDSLEVLMVTAEDSATVRKFVSSHGPIPHVVLTGDKVLNMLFPNRIIPHYVWIDPQGIYLGATDILELTDVRVRQILRGNSALGHVKKDMDTSIPLYSSTDLPVDQTLHYSVLVKGWNPGLPSGTQDIYQGKVIVGKMMTNASYQDIYTLLAYGLFALSDVPAHPSSMFFMVKDTSMFKNEYFNYELRTTVADAGNLYRNMLADLSRYFPYKVEFNKEMRPYWALRLLGGKVAEASISKSMDLKRLLSRLNGLSEQMPVLDETGLGMEFKGSFGKDVIDLDGLKPELRSLGVELVLAHKEMYRFVLSDKETIDHVQLNQQ